MNAPKGRRRILGLDPGSRVAGFAILESSNSSFNIGDSKVIDAGILRLSSKEHLFYRVGEFHRGISQIIDEFSPDLCVMESIFFAKNPKSALSLGQVRGAAIAAASVAGVEIAEISPTEVKKAITGRGHASKEDVASALETLLGFKRKNLPHDVSDAVAISLAYACTKVWMSQ